MPIIRKSTAPYLGIVGPVIRILFCFLFFFAPKLFYNRLRNWTAILWISLIIALLLAFFLSMGNIKIPDDVYDPHNLYEKIREINDFMRSLRRLRIPVLFYVFDLIRAVSIFLYMS
ncbi:hypothetical protein LI410_mgp024 (mitochondrion) [Apium graveolens]|uniref:hypothetical protein n=1 Tax=Apium graveolens TaxID=4045 RepID=UPI001D00958A|nr:hypothetical protein LI410_mgp024 [Apium graveolens]QVJ97959.1 hypothetical protein [Apium graveolens]